MLEQKSICKALVMIRKLIWIIDDGYHNKDIGNLIHISNELYGKLTEKNKKKFDAWLERKTKEIQGE